MSRPALIFLSLLFVYAAIQFGWNGGRLYGNGQVIEAGKSYLGAICFGAAAVTLWAVWS
jgi:hypothetical protein